MSELWSALACRENQGKRNWCLQQEGCGLDMRGTILTVRKDAVWGRLWNGGLSAKERHVWEIRIRETSVWCSRSWIKSSIIGLSWEELVGS